MFDPILFDNPYEKVYRFANPCHEAANRQEAQTIIKHLGLMYNTFGLAIKDFVKLVSSKFQPKFEENNQLEVKVNRQGYSQHSQNTTLSMPTQDKQMRMSQNVRNIHTEKTRSNMHTISEESPYGKHVEVQGKSDDKLSQNSQFSVTSHQQNGAIAKVANSSNNFFQPKPLILPVESPPKEESYDKNMNFQMFQLSHKQKLKDPSLIIIEEDPYSSGKKYENPFMKQEPAKIAEEKQEQSYNWSDEPNQEDSMLRVVGGKKKKDREKLMGISCVECEKYYKIMQIEGKNICDCTSRHRSNKPAKKFKNKFTQDFDLK